MLELVNMLLVGVFDTQPERDAITGVQVRILSPHSTGERQQGLGHPEPFTTRKADSEWVEIADNRGSRWTLKRSTPLPPSGGASFGKLGIVSPNANAKAEMHLQRAQVLTRRAGSKPDR